MKTIGVLDAIEIDGQKYCAIESPVAGKCGNCAFKKGLGCRLAEVKGSALPYCAGTHRQDGRDLNFIPAYSASSH